MHAQLSNSRPFLSPSSRLAGRSSARGRKSAKVAGVRQCAAGASERAPASARLCLLALERASAATGASCVMSMFAHAKQQPQIKPQISGALGAPKLHCPAPGRPADGRDKQARSDQIKRPAPISLAPQQARPTASCRGRPGERAARSAGQLAQWAPARSAQVSDALPAECQ